MKKIFGILLGILFCTCVMAQAPRNNNEHRPHPAGQRPHMSIEEFLQMKTDFIIKEMHLGAADSAKFAPIYAAQQKAKGQSMQKYHNDRQVMRKIFTGQNVTDEEYLKAIENEVQMPIEEAQSDKACVEKLKGVLTPKQIYDYLRAERKFKAEMMNRRERK